MADSVFLGEEPSHVAIAEALAYAFPIGSARRSTWWHGGHASYRIGKRALDVILASLALVVLWPVLLVAAIAIRLDSPGPALFRQRRAGLGGCLFTMFKFRGMYVDARDRFPELYSYDYRADQLADLRFHPERDPRVTRVGHFLRKTSIDELPNLFNVLLGDMSLVGPRPEIPEMLPYYGEAVDIVLSVKPGVTSPAKAWGRDELSFLDTLKLDLSYIRQRSLWFDICVLLDTVVAVIRQEGVY